MGSRIPDLDTEPQEPARTPETTATLVDSDLYAPRIPTPQLAFPDDTLPSDSAQYEAPTVDIEHMPEQQRVFASWEESKEFIVGVTAAPVKDESSALRRKVHWITLALVASLAAQVGGFLADRLIPSVVERLQQEESTYERVRKSARSIDTARRLGHPVSSELELLQREAEQAAVAGNAALARQKIDEINARWPRRE